MDTKDDEDDGDDDDDDDDESGNEEGPDIDLGSIKCDIKIKEESEDEDVYNPMNEDTDVKIKEESETSDNLKNIKEYITFVQNINKRFKDSPPEDSTEEKAQKPGMPCNHCGAIFSNKTALHKHILIHDAKPFSCPRDDCDSTFINAAVLKRHMLSHSGVKPFICPYCPQVHVVKLEKPYLTKVPYKYGRS